MGRGGHVVTANSTRDLPAREKRTIAIVLVIASSAGIGITLLSSERKMIALNLIGLVCTAAATLHAGARSYLLFRDGRIALAVLAAARAVCWGLLTLAFLSR